MRELRRKRAIFHLRISNATRKHSHNSHHIRTTTPARTGRLPRQHMSASGTPHRARNPGHALKTGTRTKSMDRQRNGTRNTQNTERSTWNTNHRHHATWSKGQQQTHAMPQVSEGERTRGRANAKKQKRNESNDIATQRRNDATTQRRNDATTTTFRRSFRRTQTQRSDDATTQRRPQRRARDAQGREDARRRSLRTKIRLPDCSDGVLTTACILTPALSRSL